MGYYIKYYDLHPKGTKRVGSAGLIIKGVIFDRENMSTFSIYSPFINQSFKIIISHCFKTWLVYS